MKRLRTWKRGGPVLLGVCLVAFTAGGFDKVEAGVVLDSPDLPPEPEPRDCDLIVSLYAGQGVHAVFPGPIDMSDPIHKCFTNVVRADDGAGNEIETFDSILDAMVDVGFGPIPVTLTGPVTTIVFGKTGNTTGMFDTEIIAMSLTGDVGGLPVEVRESPTLPSQGQTTITDLGGGLWEIDSFFDVFTELSVNGSPFMPQTSPPARMELVPNPGIGLCDPDLDHDGDVDVNDFLTFSTCFNGSLNPPNPACPTTNADLDGDGDVDVNDFLTFSTCFNGALNPPNAACPCSPAGS